MSVINDEAIIEKFREMVAKRYEYQNLAKIFDLPKELDEDVVKNIEGYFLNDVYPTFKKRKELDDTFLSLGRYIKDPMKIKDLLGNMTKALFTFGFQFPKAFKAAMSSLDAFMGAKKFEADMTKRANNMNIQLPMSDEDYEKAMASLPRKDVDTFIKDVVKLFKSMTDTKLLAKTIEIMDNTIEIMKKKPEVYPTKDVEGFILGKGILINGYNLFSQYDKKTKDLMVDFILKNEKRYTEYVFDKWN